jgi:hypothetical protein
LVQPVECGPIRGQWLGGIKGRISSRHAFNARSHPDVAALAMRAATSCGSDTAGNADRSSVIVDSEGTYDLMDAQDGFIYWVRAEDE